MLFSLFHFNIQAQEASISFNQPSIGEGPLSPVLTKQGSAYYSSLAFSRGSQISYYSGEALDDIASNSSATTESLPQISEVSDGLDDQVIEKDHFDLEETENTQPPDPKLEWQIVGRRYKKRCTIFPSFTLKNKNGDIISLKNGKINAVETYAFSLSDDLREMHLPFTHILSIDLHGIQGKRTFINALGITINHQNHSQLIPWALLTHIIITQK